MYFDRCVYIYIDMVVLSNMQCTQRTAVNCIRKKRARRSSDSPGCRQATLTCIIDVTMLRSLGSFGSHMLSPFMTLPMMVRISWSFHRISMGFRLDFLRHEIETKKNSPRKTPCRKQVSPMITLSCFCQANRWSVMKICIQCRQMNHIC